LSILEGNAIIFLGIGSQVEHHDALYRLSRKRQSVLPIRPTVIKLDYRRKARKPDTSYRELVFIYRWRENALCTEC